MEDKKKLAVLIVNHLKSQLNSGGFSEEALESLEVSVQCIESAYNINSIECDNINLNLEEIVKTYLEDIDIKSNIIKTEIKEEEIKEEPDGYNKEEAEYHKNCGNEFMKNQNNDKAVEAYSKSISLDSTNPIYYCNRAAAYNALGKYYDAIDDCQKAIQLEPTYSKAYCRLGLAFSYLKDFHKASSCYKKACELEPDNVGYRKNLQLTLNNLKSPSESESQPVNETTLPSNLMDTATRLMRDPEVSSILNNLMDDVTSSGSNGLDRLMEVGQTIVARLQDANPNLITGLRMQFQNGQNGDQQTPPNTYNHDDNAHP